jgi:hypothetical protein
MLQLRPHHVLDIVRNIGHNRPIEPHPLGHNVHGITLEIINKPDQQLKLVIGADDICIPCTKLNSESICTDVLPQCDDKPSKQTYNDALDIKVLQFLDLKEGTQLTVRQYLQIVNAKLEGIEKICTHPKEDENYRLEGLRKGLQKLGIL